LPAKVAADGSHLAALLAMTTFLSALPQRRRFVLRS